jgi:dTDP-4-amino-4,6-dideoxygalactose transaminase
VTDVDTRAVKALWPAWPVHDEREVAAVTRVVEGGNWWRYSYAEGVELSETPVDGDPRSEVVRFQHAFAQRHDCQYGIAACNGTAALEIAMRAVGVEPGHEVIVPAYTFIASASSVLMINAVPIFVDVEPDTYNIDPARIEEAVTDRTKAIMPVHFGGQPADMDAINAIARKHNIAVVADAAHAHGSSYKGRMCGSLGDAACFSFQLSKPMTAGEGGLTTTNRREVARACESLVWGGRKLGEPWYRHFVLAGNARMLEIQGAILSVQLERLDEQVERRMRNAALLDELLAGIDGVTPCVRRHETTAHSYHIYMVRYDPAAFSGMSKYEFVEALVAAGITPAMTGYDTPLYQNPMFLEKRMYGGACPVDCPRYGRDIDYADFAEKCPVSERACSTEAVWLTMNALLAREEEMHLIADTIRKVQQKASQRQPG